MERLELVMLDTSLNTGFIAVQFLIGCAASATATMSSATDTDFLVVGSGPAGAALGAFLGQNGKMELFNDVKD